MNDEIVLTKVEKGHTIRALIEYREMIKADGFEEGIEQIQSIIDKFTSAKNKDTEEDNRTDGTPSGCGKE